MIVDEQNKAELSKIQGSNTFKNYKFNVNELRRMKIDLTFIDSRSTNKDSMSKAVEFTRNSTIIYPEIKPLMRFLKRLLHVYKLNNSFNGMIVLKLGGLASFSLFLLILAFVKIYRINFNNRNTMIPNTSFNLGKLLTEFLVYYGTYHDFGSTLINVNLEK